MQSEQKFRIVVGSDHAGRELLEFLKSLLYGWKYEYIDVTPKTEGPIDYPLVAIEVAKKVSSGEFDRGILVCGTGMGMSMIANRFPNVRATLAYDAYTAEMSRKHNNSNILTMGGRTIGQGVAEQILRIWLKTPFEGERHAERLKILAELDKKIKIGD